MTDIFPQWLDHPSSTTSTYYGIRDSLGGLHTTMPRLQDSNWATPPASHGTTREGRSPPRGRGGQQGEHWTQPEPSRVDIYAAVDSWRSYSNDGDTLQSSLAGQTSSNPDFDPYGQVFNAQAHGRQTTSQPLNMVQAPQDRSNAWRPTQRPQQTQVYSQQSVGATSLYRPNAQWPQHASMQAAASQSHFTLYEPLRFSNGLQERSHQTYQPAGGSRRDSQPTFVQQVPMRPSRGVDRSRGYSASYHQPRASMDREYTAPSRPGDRQNNPRQSTPQREYVAPAPPTPPVARQAYLIQAHLRPEQLERPKRLLIILDLNGTLVLKPNFKKPEEIRIRPGAQQLLEYFFAHHSVMVYTSAQPHNAESVARHLFSKAQYDKLAAIWARDKLDLTPTQYKAKVQVYKKLDKIWANSEIQASFFPPGGGKWDQTNTILVDDSHIKALQEPHNLLQVIEFTGNSLHLPKKKFDKHEEQICRSLVVKLEVLKWQNDVSRLIWRWQTGKTEIPKLPGSNFFVDEKVDQKEQVRKDLEAAINLPTPRSPATSDSEESDENGVSLLTRKVRGESPVGEAVFKNLLSGGRNKARDVRTPESLDG